MSWIDFWRHSKEAKPASEQKTTTAAPVSIWEIGPNALSEGRVLSDAVEHINAGGVILVREAMQRAGVWTEATQIIQTSIGKALDPETQRILRDAGLGRMHEVLTGEQIKACNVSAHILFNDWAIHGVPTLVREAVGYRGAGKFDNNTVIRYFVPLATYKADRKQLEDRPGYTKPQGPHVDTWFGHATAGLNLWMAIEPVRRGNGLAIFPDKWQIEIPHDKQLRPLRDQDYGLPITFEMNPGDLLLFHGEHLHSSELNSTAWTRVVLTARFSVEKPKIVSKNTIAEWRTLPPSEAAAKSVTIAESGAESSPSEFRRTYASTEGDGSIRVLDEKWIEVTHGGETNVLSRICTHEGADLSCGYIQNGRVYCSWHHMNFDPSTGQAACAGIPPLRVPPVA